MIHTVKKRNFVLFICLGVCMYILICVCVDRQTFTYTTQDSWNAHQAHWGGGVRSCTEL